MSRDGGNSDGVLTVALTGNVASGKSTVAELWRQAGVPVVDADELARRAVEPGSPALRAIVESFGPEALSVDGSMDRGWMRRRVFDDDEARRTLEEIVHPTVWELRAEWVRGQREAGAELVVCEIPLLFETGREADFDQVVLVDAPVPQRLERMTSARGLGAVEATAIIDSQAEPEAKRARADLVIDNGGSTIELEERARAVLATLRERAGVATMRLDLHLHTRGSWDCLTDPERVLDLALARGFQRIAITDHNRLGLALRMAESHPDEVIAGEEVRTAEGIDVIGLYLTEEIPKGTPAEETIERIRAQGGIPYLPHPYAGGKGGGGRHAERLAPLCDVVEVFNARLHSPDANSRALELARRHGRLYGAGSDAHSLGEIGNAYVDVPAHLNRPRALLQALRQARTGGREAPLYVHLASTWAKVRKKLPGA